MVLVHFGTETFLDLRCLNRSDCSHRMGSLQRNVKAKQGHCNKASSPTKLQQPLSKLVLIVRISVGGRWYLLLHLFRTSLTASIFYCFDWDTGPHNCVLLCFAMASKRIVCQCMACACAHDHGFESWSYAFLIYCVIYLHVFVYTCMSWYKQWYTSLYLDILVYSCLHNMLYMIYLLVLVYAGMYFVYTGMYLVYTGIDLYIHCVKHVYTSSLIHVCSMYVVCAYMNLVQTQYTQLYSVNSRKLSWTTHEPLHTLLYLDRAMPYRQV
jgi:hypothetical protein